VGMQTLEDNPNRVMHFDVPYEAGELVAVGLNGGVEVSRSVLKTSGAPVALKLTPKMDKLTSNGWDTALVEVTAVDADGNVCPAEGDVVFSAEGAGKLVAVCNGSLTFHGPFQGDTVPMANDRATGYARAGLKGGVIRVKACWNGLEGTCDVRVI